MTASWLLDSYPIGDKMISWVRHENQIKKIKDDWTPSIFVACDEPYKLQKLISKEIPEHIKHTGVVEKFEKVTSTQKCHILQLQLDEADKIIPVAKKIEAMGEFGTIRLYNVDIPPPQSYFYEKDLFPFAKCRKVVDWILEDSAESVNYQLPDFKITSVSVKPKKTAKIPKFTNKIDSILIDDTEINSTNEEDIIVEFVKLVQKKDPDFIITRGGDSFDFPYLIYRAQKNQISDKLIINRDNIPLSYRCGPKTNGASYFSYGKIYFKPAAVNLYGRIHIDTANCFIWNNQYDLYGLIEIARVCRMPMQAASRASIGKCMSSLQFYNATKRDLLIPWKPTMAEAFKTRKELFIADRGGLIFEPEIGVHENVAELDFSSLYPNIMYKKNISAETILCKCCADSENRVPQLNYHICKKLGIVPQSLEILLKKRKMYTDLLSKTGNKIYEARRLALKWILVTSFGYLGFSNAKFGRIDAHIAVCAFARHTLLQAVRIAEEHGFHVLHGIVDSLWVYKNGATKNSIHQIKRKIEEKTGFEMSLDMYKWVAFLPSKNGPGAAENRYFGVLQDGKIKARGIELRRHDTPVFFKKFQLEVLELFGGAKNVEQVCERFLEAQKIYEKYTGLLQKHLVPPEELAFTTRVSKNLPEYKSKTVMTDAMTILVDEGKPVNPGKSFQYVITNYFNKSRRAVPLDVLNGTHYDAKKYVKFLYKCFKTIIEPFEIYKNYTN